MDIYQVEEILKSSFNIGVSKIEKLPLSGSNREYFRCYSDSETFIFTSNSDTNENESFVNLSKVFESQNLHVPHVIKFSSDKKYYIQSDLGDTTLFSVIQKNNFNYADPKMKTSFQSVVENLQKFQFAAGLKSELFFARPVFDQTAMLWDLNYFKYSFLKLAYIPFDEEKLEKDFRSFTDFLCEVPSNYFMFRDFQTRNIMIVDDTPNFIDFQGGRFGALQYDLASLLFDAKANIDNSYRKELVDYYCQSLETNYGLDKKSFLKYLPSFILLRILQNFGTYGYRGFYEKKSHFLQSVTFASKNLKMILSNLDIEKEYPELHRVCNCIIEQFSCDKSEETAEGKIVINISSISLKKNYPEINQQHGGGFVFDCRCLPNPGRIKEFSQMNGKDQPVKKYLDDCESVQKFMELAISMIKMAVENYFERDFKYLSVAFGCTGGQHRSVYCAEMLAQELRFLYGESTKIVVKHTELEK